MGSKLWSNCSSTTINHKHPLFEIVCLTASQKSVGKRYSEATKWYPNFLGKGIPEEVGNMTVVDTNLNAIEKANVEIAFSALPADISKETEPEFARAGITIVSKSNVFRLDPHVPLLVPEINPNHLELLKVQKKAKNWRGCIVADPNCTTTGLVLSLKPILDFAGIKRVFVATMQAVSGAGYLGVSPIAINGNVLPYIHGEEEKTQNETLKILGRFEGDKVEPLNIKVSSICNRVNVDYGHIEDVFIETEKPCAPEEVKEVLRKFRGAPQELNLHSAPEHPIVVRDEEDRPQPKLDVNEGKGMSVVVGRVRRDPAFENGVKYTLLVHNTVRGGAGMAVLNAELLARKGLLN